MENFVRFIGFLVAPLLWDLSPSWRQRYYETRRSYYTFDNFVQDEFWKKAQKWGLK